ncbi:hypothetical protein [Lysinibacillus piscis]|uniref:Uncharacterized protein n=1 Tax=Lysinibacillus piscis TaxID=2518931 RepID=A0ABQ5NLW4_9BACI|nr:hypothetical protein [Lysinibacillus sp. KH24]GLC89351.1 hypothetical protein LYSBPC_24780 [Lysinibacillus sp. KH24]
MTAIQLDVLFKKIQKDDKKEILEFHVLGDEIPHKSELIGMAGGVAILEIGDVKLSAEFKSIQRDSKKAALKFEAKGDSEDKIIRLYPKAGSNVKLSLEPSQMSIEDFNDGHEGIGYTVNGDGTASVPSDQMSMDDVEEPEEEIDDEDDLLD